MHRDTDPADARAREEALSTLLACVPDAVIVTDRAGCIRQVNPQASALLGYTAEEFLGMDLKALMPPRTAAQHDAHMAGYGRGRGGMTAEGREVVARRKDGALVPVDIRVGVMPLRGGLCFVGFMRDISTRIRERETLMESERRLQRQLMQAQKMEALGQLTGGLAHDFNNMLGSILGLSTLALERLVEDPQSKLAIYLREIVKAAGRGRDLVARLMSFARPAAPAPTAPQAVRPIVEEVLAMLGPTMAPSLVFEFACAPGLPAAMLIEGELQQVLANLLINARDAVEGVGLVTISADLVVAHDCECSCCGRHIDGRRVSLRVRDQGSGIPAELLPRIFDPFFTTKQVGKGTGLGLSMVQSLVHQAGGHIVVHRGTPAGTTIELLLVPADEPARAHALAPPHHPPDAHAP